MEKLTLDGKDLIGTRLEENPVPGGPTGNGISGVGPYLDCNCVLEGRGFYTPGTVKRATIEIIRGQDADKINYAGFSMTDRHPSSGQLMQFFTILRDGETGLHTWSRVAYGSNGESPKGPTRPLLQELRTLFRPNTPLWTHYVTNNYTVARSPALSSVQGAKSVQDATWDLGAFTNDPYVHDTNRYFTKYSFAEVWKDHEAHGMYSDGMSKEANGTWGAWMVQWNRETYYGGPLHADLTVDGIVYDYMISNHYGANVPELKKGFDRTFGPNYYMFNHHPASTPWKTLYDEARSYRPPTVFLNAAATHIPGYVPLSQRTSFSALVTLPKTGSRGHLILSASGVDVQDNSASPNAYQYWAEVPSNGTVVIKDIVPGTYRVTLYADGVFGTWTKDNVNIRVSSATSPFNAVWEEEKHGTELWRIGTPDHSAGEFRHGYEIDKKHRLGLQEYRIFYGAYNFDNDFPNGVQYRIGQSKPERDWNYVQWASPRSNTWRVLWTMQPGTIKKGNKATLTVQAAGVRTAVGNVHSTPESARFANLDIKAAVNSKSIGTWTVPYNHSSSCAVRSGIICYNTRHLYTFNADLLKEGENILTLSLPAGAGGNSGGANLPSGVYVQYDALRLEI
jgi:rhamnogalacturonan endolyase